MPNFRMSTGQIDDLLDNVIDTRNPNFWKSSADGDEKLVCCPVHGESNPSMGVNADKGVCHCFSCGFAGDFAKLLAYSKPEEFGLNRSTEETEHKTYYKAYRKALEFLIGRYELEYHEIGLRVHNVKRFEQIHNRFLKEDSQERVVLPRFKIAPFMSGKETYQYFFQRGFTKENMKTYMIGRDLDNKTITIPVFYEDGELAGVIGRYIDPNRKKNQRYKIYFDFARSSILYPLNIAKPKNGTIILVEGQFDAIRMHNLGYMNTFSAMTGIVSRAQIEWIASHCDTVIYVGDNDERGLQDREKARELMKGKVTFKTVTYPDYGKDVCDWKEDDIRYMISNAHGTLNRKVRRL